MAWANTLLECSFKGLVFDVVGTRDTYGRAVSVAEFPYLDGGRTDDLGEHARRYALQAVFFGDDYEDRYFKALNVFNAQGAGELVHPVVGVIKAAQCLSCEVVHEASRPDSCTVALVFIEDSTAVSFFEEAGPVAVQSKVGSLGDSALQGAANWLSEAVSSLREALPFEALADLRATMVGPLLGFMSEVQGISTSGLDVLDEPRAWARDISALSNGVIASAGFGDNLLGDWRSVTGVFQRLGDDYGYGGGAANDVNAAAPAWSSSSVPSEAQASAVANAYLSVNGATAQADVAAIVLAAEADAPTLSPAEIESVVNASRSEIAAAIDIVRSALVLELSRPIVEALKDQALALQIAGRQLMELRPPLVQRAIEAPGNLRLIAHLWYGDHSRATELARLNNLRRPNALQAGEVINAYLA